MCGRNCIIIIIISSSSSSSSSSSITVVGIVGMPLRVPIVGLLATPNGWWMPGMEGDRGIVTEDVCEDGM